METLRCPTCLNRLADGNEKRCSACGTRIRARRRSGAPDEAMRTRPRELVERELQARIEAQTAQGYRARRRAVKKARRIAALPPDLFVSGVIPEPEHAAWRDLAAEPTVIDLPVAAVRETKAAANESTPEPLALVAPVFEISKPDPVDDAPATEPVCEATPNGRKLVARFEERWQLWRASRAAAAEAERRAAELRAVEIEPEPEPEPAPPREPAAAPIVEKPAPTREAQRPAAARRAPAPPVLETVASDKRGAVEWQPSDSLWAKRVFNAQGQAPGLATWPRPRAVASSEREREPERDYIDAPVSEPAGAE